MLKHENRNIMGSVIQYDETELNYSSDSECDFELKDNQQKIEETQGKFTFLKSVKYHKTKPSLKEEPYIME